MFVLCKSVLVELKGWINFDDSAFLKIKWITQILAKDNFVALYMMVK